MDPDDVMYEDPGDVELLAVLAGLREQEILPLEGFVERLSAFVDRELRWRRPVRRIAHDRRAQYAAISLGGAILGALAVGLLVRRNIRRQAVA